MPETEPMLEAVYYGSPIPASMASLSLLGVVFDRLHFPNVHIPSADFDLKAVADEAERIQNLGLKDYNTALLVRALRLLPQLPYLRDFC